MTTTRQTTTSTATTATTVTVRLATSRNGLPMPRLDLRAPRGTHHRLVAAELHALAARAERGTDAAEGWCIYVERGRDDLSGSLVIELVGDDDAEAARAMALLARLAA